MSRWLKSVNSLLETLDGKAETVVDTQALGKLLENSRDVVAAGLRRENSGDYSTEDGESVDDDDGDYDGDYDDDLEGAEDQTNLKAPPPPLPDLPAEAENSHPPTTQTSAGLQQPSLHDSKGSTKNKVHVNTPPRQKRPDGHDDATVSDISFSECTEDDQPPDATEASTTATASAAKQRPDDGDKISDSKHSKTSTTNNNVQPAPGADFAALPVVDAPPKTPNRHVSHSGELKDMSITTSLHDRSPGAAAAKTPKANNKVTTSSPKVDESPRHPRRSIEAKTQMPSAGPNLLEELGEDGDVTVNSKLDDAGPPRPPNRYPSLPVNQDQPVAATGTSKETVLQTVPPAPPSSSSNKLSVKNTKEYQKLKEKIQTMQGQLTKTTSELKTSQTLIQSLQTQNQALQTKLEAAHTEILAQSDELRRAGERMEKDRIRAQEEREDLLDEQDEELEQLNQRHQQEMDTMRKQYEAQVADLTNQLHAEETKRRQEGGDYTQELQDAIERERDALKKLNVITLEKTQLQTQLSKFELQQSALQAKLDAAFQSVKIATEREREAEDKLDAAVSLYSRQMTQRQARESELEKTIFDLGTALTVLRQKEGSSLTTKNDKIQEREGESFKDKYVAAAEELETLKVQFSLETQRREALQEELNDIAKERSEEASNAQARQRLHDRKVAELESSLARLQATMRDQKAKIGKNKELFDTHDPDPSILSQELQDAKREIENLSTQLLRHQTMAEVSKSEVLALKGRLQAATNRAEQAEQSLQLANSTAVHPVIAHNHMYNMEAGGGIVGGARRRIKGGTSSSRTRTLRSALHMSPGRNSNPLVEQLVTTLEALDHWMVDTGSFLRHEPLARLALMLYFIILHLWSFALVVFHTTEQPHADFGSLDSDPRHWRAAAALAENQESVQHPT